MASSHHCTWPPATVWRTVFRRHYSQSSASKWHQLYVETSCVLLGLKTALLVDCVSPSAEKLRLFLKEVRSQHGCTRSVVNIEEEEDGGCHSGPVNDENQFFTECMSNCCILTIGEDTLLVNMECLSLSWGLKGEVEDVHTKCDIAQLASTCAVPLHRDSDRLLYVDITQGLQQPKLLSDKEESTVTPTRLFKQWLTKVYSTFLAADKTEIIIIPCCSSVELCTSHQRLDCRTSTHQSNICTSAGGDSTSQTNETCTHTVFELNMCTLFGQLLDYPVVYWFNTEGGYSLDMVELVCYSVSITNSDLALSDSSKISYINIEEEHLLYSFTVPKCLHLITCDQVKVWFAGVYKRAARLGFVPAMNKEIVCLMSPAL